MPTIADWAELKDDIPVVVTYRYKDSVAAIRKSAAGWHRLTDGQPS